MWTNQISVLVIQEITEDAVGEELKLLLENPLRTRIDLWLFSCALDNNHGELRFLHCGFCPACSTKIALSKLTRDLQLATPGGISASSYWHAPHGTS